MKKFVKKMLFIPVLVSVLVFSGCGGGDVSKPYSVRLEVWGTFDSSDTFTEIISAYKDINKNVIDIDYKKITQDTYKKELKDALASGNGPDIFIINNTWLPEFSVESSSMLAPMPDYLTEMNKMQDNFVDTVSKDFIKNGKIYALPLSVDSLVLYYNKTLFNAAGITAPPKNWDEFNDYAKRLTKFDENGNIYQSGAAMGTAKNINRFSDILSMIMMQNKAEMVSSSKTSVTMANKIPGQNGEVSPGENALTYYTQFADRDSALYTWNDEQHYSLDAFSENKLGMMFNYSWHIDTIMKKDAKLSFDIAPVPQYDELRPLTYANYWAFGVSNIKNITVSKNPKKPAGDNNARIHEAWQFLKYLTMKNEGTMELKNAYTKSKLIVPVAIDPAKKYLEKTGRPAARKDLLDVQKNDPLRSVFAKSNLIATSWYQKDPEAIENILSEVVNQVTKSGIEPSRALSWGVSRMSETMR